MNSSLPLLATGEVRHARLRPAQHQFAYPTFFLLLPMRAWQSSSRDAPTWAALPRNRWGWLSFYDRDHGNGGPDALAWLDNLLREQGVLDATGEVWLQTYPRVLGYVFKPVSFWYCHRTDGALAAVVAEVNNTFGERHCYLLCGDGHGNSNHNQVAWGRTLQARKVFHVSPFCDVQGHYEFRFMRTDDRVVARVDHADEQGPLLRTSVSGRLSPLSVGSARRAVWRMPLLTLGVVARIHWQALNLWIKRVPFFRKPEPPGAFTTR